MATDPSGYVLAAVLVWFVSFGLLGMFVASQKDRSTGEVLMLGALFGPLGALIEALLPNGQPAAKQAKQGGRGRPSPVPRAAGVPDHLDPDLLEFLTAKMSELLDQADPDWRLLPYHRKSALVGPIDKRLRSFVMGTQKKMTATEYSDYSSAARRALIG